MKTQLLRVSIPVLAGTLLSLCVGCERGNANAEEVPVFAQPATDDTAGEAGNTPDTNTVAQAAPQIIRPADAPENLNISPGLAEIIKLVQAGVSEEVMLAYITNSTNLYYLGSDEIVYLNDLGVSTTVITALIQRDNTVEAQAQKKSTIAASPLPEGVAVTTPATNVYPQPATRPAPAPDASTAPQEPAGQYAAADGSVPPESVTYFYEPLSSYGNWVQVPDYGLCWQPTVAVVDSYWRPYADHGRWLWTDAGWYWYSDYSWGWAPFHYGRWCSYPSLGWIWVPDTVWGPSWVNWRYSSYHCGWAPLPPRSRFVSGFGLFYGDSSVSLSFGFGLGWDAYTFVPWNRFCDRTPYHYFVSRPHARSIYRDTTVINNYVVGDNNTIINRGFGIDRVARATRAEIEKVSIRTVRPSAAGAISGRREHLENDGAALAVVRPDLPRSASRPSRAGRGLAEGNARVEPATLTENAPPVRRPEADGSGADLSRRIARPNRLQTEGVTTSAPGSEASPPLLHRGQDRIKVFKSEPAVATASKDNSGPDSTARSGPIFVPNVTRPARDTGSDIDSRRIARGSIGRGAPSDSGVLSSRPAASSGNGASISRPNSNVPVTRPSISKPGVADAPVARRPFAPTAQPRSSISRPSISNRQSSRSSSSGSTYRAWAEPSRNSAARPEIPAAPSRSLPAVTARSRSAPNEILGSRSAGGVYSSPRNSVSIPQPSRAAPVPSRPLAAPTPVRPAPQVSHRSYATPAPARVSPPASRPQVTAPSGRPSRGRDLSDIKRR